GLSADRQAVLSRKRFEGAKVPLTAKVGSGRKRYLFAGDHTGSRGDGRYRGEDGAWRSRISARVASRAVRRSEADAAGVLHRERRGRGVLWEEEGEEGRIAGYAASIGGGNGGAVRVGHVVADFAGSPAETRFGRGARLRIERSGAVGAEGNLATARQSVTASG